jgi:ISXO2-like transposase domain
MVQVKDATAANIRDVLVRDVSRDTELQTDESRLYTETGKEYAGHHAVKHSAGEYVRYEAAGIVHTSTVENIFSVFKRGMYGVYQHCGEARLPRYLTEFEFRQNRRTAVGDTDTMRCDDAIRGAEGKRLLCRQPD